MHPTVVAMALLSLKNLQKRFGALLVTNDVSLDVSEREIVGILGPNGAGKTTLFNLIAGTVKPDEGQVYFKGEDISSFGVSERCRKGVSRSFQIPHPLSGMSVYENILVGATFGKAKNTINPEINAAEILQITGLKSKANDLAGSLTLLERKRLEMARALATDPKLLLLDEIAGGLTERECQSLLNALRDVHQSGVTIVWIEHVVHALLSVAQRLVVINFGKKIADGNPHDVINSSEVRSVYMGEDAHV